MGSQLPDLSELHFQERKPLMCTFTGADGTSISGPVIPPNPVMSHQKSATTSLLRP